MSAIPHSRTVLADEDIDAATEVLRSGQVNDSGTTRELEAEVAAELGRRRAWAAASGTEALHSTLIAMGIGAGDEVLIPTYVCDDVISAVIQAGATPVAVDIDPDDLNPDPADAEAKATVRTRAVVLGHVLGMPARVGGFGQLGVPVIEDCAHGLGGEAGGAPAGSLGDATVLSFHGLKMIGAGEGGMIVSDDEGIAASLERGASPDFAAGEHRRRTRLTNVVAAVARSQLARLAETVERRRALARRYSEAIAQVSGARAVTIEADEGRRSSCYRFAVVTGENTGFSGAEAAFAERGVTVRRPVKQLSHRTLGSGSCPIADEVFDRVVSLPLYPSLTEAEQDAVIEAAQEVLA